MKVTKKLLELKEILDAKCVFKAFGLFIIRQRFIHQADIKNMHAFMNAKVALKAHPTGKLVQHFLIHLAAYFGNKIEVADMLSQLRHLDKSDRITLRQ